MYYYADETVKRLERAENIVIFGAHIVAEEVANCLKGEPYRLSISAFMVTDIKNNPSSILGIPVIHIQTVKEQYPDALILVAVLDKNYGDILKVLKGEGFSDIIPMTFESGLWSELRGNFFRDFILRQGRKYLTLEEILGGLEVPEDRGKVNIYRAVCDKDRRIKADMGRYVWEIPIQAGAILAENQIAAVRDNQGENISYKNEKYCELTALYWIWKNDCSKYAGLCHYRRHFDLDFDLLAKLAVSDIDVVVTLPILNFPDVMTVYSRDHIAADWEIMMEAIAALSPEYVSTAQSFQKGFFYYAYNMFIARKEILDDYCAWLFPILEYCEKRCGEKEDRYQNRYIGFLAERLLTIYFLHHQDKYVMVHALKTFLE